MTTGVEIHRVDPTSGDDFDRWYGVYDAAEAAAPPHVGSPLQAEELRVLLAEQTARRRTSALLATVDGHPVSADMLDVSLTDNLDRADISVHTHPTHARRGFGTAMLRALERDAHESGRAVCVAQTSWAWSPDNAAGLGQAGPAFAHRNGYGLALADIKRIVRLPVDLAVLDDLADRAAQRHGDYEIRCFAGPVPEDLVEGWARLTATLITEAPAGELSVEEEQISVADVREAEEVLARQGRLKLNVVALDAAREVVAFTEAVATSHEPDRCYQWGTLVRPQDRGHRLGLALKVANLRQIQDQLPDVTQVITHNADGNDHMVAVNDALGFRPVAWLGEYQRRISPDA